MKKILFATAASAAVLAATPAVAQSAAPAGPRVEAVMGYDKVKALGENDGGVLYGLGVGYDFAVAPSVSLGVDGEITDSTQEVGEEEWPHATEDGRQRDVPRDAMNHVDVHPDRRRQESDLHRPH